MILPYYKIEKTEEGKQFFFANVGYFNFWDEYLIMNVGLEYKTYEVLVINDFSSEELSNAVGKQNIKVLGITDQGFRDAILSRKRKWIIWPKNKM